VGLDTPDDAAVYALEGGKALVASVDFFTPMVDDPADFGAIAAANALSDLYAMNAVPIFALSVLSVPVGELPHEVAGAILEAAAGVCREAGILIAGGHSIDDPEPKFGLVALGLADPERLFRKSGARAGDELILGKALGTGIVTTSVKRGSTLPGTVEPTIASMRQLNRRAAEIAAERDIHAATDVTGFGLLGHLRELCAASGLAAVVRAGAPVALPGALELAAAGCVPGGTDRNRSSVEPDVAWDPEIPEPRRVLLTDAQTSGGLLLALPPDEAPGLEEALREAGYAAARIGRLEEAREPMIRVEAS